jgi:hypothetical protein
MFLGVRSKKQAKYANILLNGAVYMRVNAMDQMLGALRFAYLAGLLWLLTFIYRRIRKDPG